MAALTMIIAVSLAIKELKDELRYGDEPSPFKRKQDGNIIEMLY